MGQMLRQAVYMEDQVTLEHLVKKKADLEARDETGSTPLLVAATRCKTDTISWLISKRADLAAKDSEGFSPLSWACMKGHREVMCLLLNGRADIQELTEYSGKTPLALAAERGHFNCVLELVARGAHVGNREAEQSEHTCRNGSTALMCAAHQGETEVVAYLLERQSMVNTTDAEGWNALMHAVNAQVTQASTSGGGEDAEKRVGIDGVMGKRSATELMLLHGVDVNAQASDGLTALMIASGRDRPQAVKKLLEAGAQVNQTTVYGQNALMMSVAHGLPGVARLLILAAADVNHANEKKETALSIAEKYMAPPSSMRLKENDFYKECFDLLKRAGATDGKKGKKGKKK